MTKIIVKYDISQYSLDIDADYSSDNMYRCDCDSICRCGKITNARVSPIFSSLLYNVEVYTLENFKRARPKKLKLEQIDLYCIDRLMHLHGCYDESNYEVYVCNGYYGEEIGDVCFHNTEKLIKDVEKIIKLDALEKIKYVLNLEYSVIADIEKVCKFEINTLTTADLIHREERLFRTIKRQDANVSLHFDADMPIAVFIDGVLVDGYTRISQAIGANMHKIKVFDLYTSYEIIKIDTMPKVLYNKQN